MYLFIVQLVPVILLLVNLLVFKVSPNSDPLAYDAYQRGGGGLGVLMPIKGRRWFGRTDAYQRGGGDFDV